MKIQLNSNVFENLTKLGLQNGSLSGVKDTDLESETNQSIDQNGERPNPLISMDGLSRLEIEMQAQPDSEISSIEIENKSDNSNASIFERTVLDLAVQFKKGYDWIKNSDLDESEKSERIKILNEKYDKQASIGAEMVASALKRYFDSGTDQLNTYSSESDKVSSLIDENVVTAHIKNLAYMAKQIVYESSENMDVDALESQVKSQTSSYSTLNKMSYSDMKTVLDFIEHPSEYTVENSDVLQKTEETGETSNSNGQGAYEKALARETYNTLERINDLDVSSNIKEGLGESVKRKAEGDLRQNAMNKAVDSYEDRELRLKEEFLRLQALWKQIEERIEELKEMGLFDPESDQLMNYLERIEGINEQIDSVNERLRENSEERNGLVDNPSSITETDTYKASKLLFDNEMNRLDKEGQSNKEEEDKSEQ